MHSNQPQAIPVNNLTHRGNLQFQYDVWLISITIFLVLLGLIMVTSSSITIAERNFQNPLYYFWRQMFSVCIGLTLAFITLKIPMTIWQKTSVPMLLFGFILLILVLIPGVGREVNGSLRWVHLGPFALQASEPVKIFVIAYLAGYMVRHEQQFRESFSGFVRPIIVLTMVAGLLMLEPDYGASVVIFATALGMLFMGGVPLSRFFAWGMVAISSLLSLAVLSPYRLQRLMSFSDPWQDPFNHGFQLTQALIAFGRGDWLGVGLGGSVQKLFYLPEAHTDFVFSVLAEELGLIGSTLVIFMFCYLVWRAFVIGNVAERAGQHFSAYFTYGCGLILGIQAFINIGVNMGVLPTKGLTLPLLSYGGNSIIVTCVLIGVLLRVDYENGKAQKPLAPKVNTCVT
jgi:cell division protein FtsW